MKLSAILAPLIAAKVPHEVILQTVLAYEAEQVDALDQRRHRDAARQARKRERDALSRDVTLRHSDGVLVREGVTHVEDNNSSQQSEKGKEERKSASRLSLDWTLPEEWRADGRKVGFSEARIDDEAEAMRDWSLSSPKNGAKLDWRATWRTWCKRRAGEVGNQRAGPPKIPSQADVFREIAERSASGQYQEPEDRRSAGSVVSYLSAVGSR